MQFGPGGWRDARRLRAAHPSLAPEKAELARLRKVLEPAYSDYVMKVSEAGWAVSLETSALLYFLCRATNARALLDLGSGFSSYVLRHYTREAPYPVSVTSVDADEAWLARTKEYLLSEGCDAERVIGWAEFRDGTSEPHDIVFHDLASGSLREDAMPLAISQVGPGGVIVFDDAQHRGHRERMYAEGSAAGLHLYSLRSWTLDSIGVGRWSILGVRDASKRR